MITDRHALRVLTWLVAGLAVLFARDCVMLSAKAQDVPRHAQVDSLASRMLPLLDVWTRPDGTPTWIQHCRQAPHGCPARIHALAAVLYDASAAEHIDADLLTGIALGESGFNPRTIGTHGEAGIMQINPCRSDLPVEVREYVGPCRATDSAAVRRAARHRAECWARDDAACQRPLVAYAAHLLAQCMQRCGTVPRALAAYNTGRCDMDNGYAARVEMHRRSVAAGRVVRADLARGRGHR